MREINLTFIEDDDGVCSVTDSQLRQRISEYYGFRADLIELVSVSDTVSTNIMGYTVRAPYHVVFRVCGFGWSVYFDGEIYRDRDTDSRPKLRREPLADIIAAAEGVA